MNQQKILLLILGTNIIGFIVVIQLLLNINSTASSVLQLKKDSDESALLNAIAPYRDGLVADLNNISAMAQQYYRKPNSIGGGGGNFTGWSIPVGCDITPNGIYSIETVSAQEITIVGNGNKLYKAKLISYRATVTPTRIDILKIN